MFGQSCQHVWEEYTTQRLALRAPGTESEEPVRAPWHNDEGQANRHPRESSNRTATCLVHTGAGSWDSIHRSQCGAASAGPIARPNAAGSLPSASMCAANCLTPMARGKPRSCTARRRTGPQAGTQVSYCLSRTAPPPAPASAFTRIGVSHHRHVLLRWSAPCSEIHQSLPT